MTGISGGNQYGYTPGTVPATLQGQADKEAWEAANRRSKGPNPWASPPPQPSPIIYKPAQTTPTYRPAVPNTGYQPATFRWNAVMSALGIAPPKIMTEGELRVCREFFGNHSALEVRQTRLLNSGRLSFLMSDGQVIQRASYAEVPKSRPSRFYFRKSSFGPASIRAVVDAFESDGSHYDFSTTSPEGSAVAVTRMSKAFEYERRRRLTVVRREIKMWLNRAAGEKTSSGKQAMIGGLLAAVSSRQFSRRIVSRVYHEFEPWGASSPSPSEPNWPRLQRIVGMKG